MGGKTNPPCKNGMWITWHFLLRVSFWECHCVRHFFSEKAKALTHSIIGFAGILPISGQQGKNTFGQKFFYDLNLLSAEKSNMMWMFNLHNLDCSFAALSLPSLLQYFKTRNRNKKKTLISGWKSNTFCKHNLDAAGVLNLLGMGHNSVHLFLHKYFTPYARRIEMRSVTGYCGVVL